MEQPDATRRGFAGAGDEGVGADDVDDLGDLLDDVRDDDRIEDDAGEVAPSVVAVVVAHDPGPWFAETLTSLVEQDYPNLSILVIDNASAVDPTPQIAEIAPRAFVRRVEGNPGFGVAANLAASMVRGSQFFVFCHDDVALAPNAVRVLVEEAFRSNAGIVAPKLVRWDRPEALLAVGMGADRFGAPSSLCERGELDQEQHDAVRDVFFAPGGCFLVRSDLFSALGGFDEVITYHGDDTDLCWRAHLAGARVVVAPGARVRHLEALGLRRPDDRRRLQLRHRLRMTLTNYGWFYTVGEGVQLLLLSLFEVLASTVRGRLSHARDVIGAYTWNLRRIGSIVAKRKQVRSTRQVTDLELRRLHARGSARVTAFLRGQLGAGVGVDGAAVGTLADAGREWATSVRRGVRAENVAAVVLVAVVLAAGSRDLLTGRVPAIGELVTLPDGAFDLLRSWWGGWRETGLGVAGVAPTGTLLLGLLSTVFLGFTALARTVLVLGALPLGCWGAWRVGSSIGHDRAKAAALLAYAVNPLPYAALATGSLRGLAAYAMAPWVVRRVTVIARFAPGAATVGAGTVGVSTTGAAGAGLSPPSSRRGAAKQVAALGLTIGLGAAVSPGLAVVAAGIVVTLVIGSVLAGSREGSGRALLGGLGGCVVAVVLHAGWLSSLRPGDGPDVDVVGRFGGAETHALSALLHFETRAGVGSMLSWGLLAAGLLGLAIGRSWRWAWAVRGWTLALVPWAIVAVVQALDASVTLPAAEVLLAPAAVGLAVAVASGVAGFDIDLPAYRFGWRQGVSVLAAAGLFVATLPWLGRAVDGRWDLPGGGFDRTLGFLAAGNVDAGTAEREAAGAAEVAGPFRVLWLGAAQVLPVAGWQIESGLAYATSMGAPSAEALWSGPETATASRIPDALDRARRGDTSRLGRELGVMGIRYVVVVDQLAPAPFETVRHPAPAWVPSTLGAQLDLQQVDLNAGIRLYRNTAWRPLVTTIGEDVQTVTDLDPSTSRDVVEAALDAAGAQRFAGTLDAGLPLVLSEASDPGWMLTEGDGRTSGPAEEDAFGWAATFPVLEGGESTLRYRTPTGHRVVLVAQLLAWLVVVLVALGVRRPQRTAVAVGASAGRPIDAERAADAEADLIWVGSLAADPDDADDPFAGASGGLVDRGPSRSEPDRDAPADPAPAPAPEQPDDPEDRDGPEQPEGPDELDGPDDVGGPADVDDEASGDGGPTPSSDDDRRGAS